MTRNAARRPYPGLGCVLDVVAAARRVGVRVAAATCEYEATHRFVPLVAAARLARVLCVGEHAEVARVVAVLVGQFLRAQARLLLVDRERLSRNLGHCGRFVGRF
jgi:hypothetical protein